MLWTSSLALAALLTPAIWQQAAPPAQTPTAKPPQTAPAAATQPESAPKPATPAPAPKPATPHAYVLIDPAHGGSDIGARLGPNVFEKDVTLAFASRLSTSLKSHDLDARQTRNADNDVTTQQRDSTAEAAVCISLHATASGSGVHVYTALPPAENAIRTILTPWNFVQHSLLPQSRSFAAGLSAQLQSTGLTVLSGDASLPVLDGFNCTAVAIELAPADLGNGKTVTAADPAYQQRVADAITNAVLEWKSKHPPRSAK